jgi:Cu/Ag efflux protein CusF
MKTRWIVGVAASCLAAAVLAQTPTTQGEVTKLDKAQGKVTLKHGEIKNLDMPAMTMVFQARDPKMLDGLNVGDRVRFAAEKVDGRFTVTVLSKAP